MVIFDQISNRICKIYTTARFKSNANIWISHTFFSFPWKFLRMWQRRKVSLASLMHLPSFYEIQGASKSRITKSMRQINFARVLRDFQWLLTFWLSFDRTRKDEDSRAKRVNRWMRGWASVTRKRIRYIIQQDHTEHTLGRKKAFLIFANSTCYSDTKNLST